MMGVDAGYAEKAAGFGTPGPVPDRSALEDLVREVAALEMVCQSAYERFRELMLPWAEELSEVRHEPVQETALVALTGRVRRQTMFLQRILQEVQL